VGDRNVKGSSIERLNRCPNLEKRVVERTKPSQKTKKSAWGPLNYKREVRYSNPGEGTSLNLEKGNWWNRKKRLLRFVIPVERQETDLKGTTGGVKKWDPGV